MRSGPLKTIACLIRPARSHLSKAIDGETANHFGAVSDSRPWSQLVGPVNKREHLGFESSALHLLRFLRTQFGRLARKWFHFDSFVRSFCFAGFRQFAFLPVSPLILKVGGLPDSP